MTTAERIRLLRRHGLENAVIAAVLGVNCDAIADHIADPSIDVAIPGGGGAVDVTGLMPLDGSRSATLIDFAGTGETAGGTLAWNDDWDGLMFKGRPGSGDAELYLVSPDNEDCFANLYPGGLGVQDGTGGGANLSGYALDGYTASGYGFHLDGVNGLIAHGPGGSAQLSPDFSYIKKATGSLAADRRFFSFGHQADIGTRFNISPDGELAWGDGTGNVNQDASLKRTAPGTLEIDHTLSFKGDPTGVDVFAGATLTWDNDDWYAMVLKGQPGSGGTGLALINDDDTDYTSLQMSGLEVGGTTTPGSASVGRGRLHLRSITDAHVLDYGGAILQLVTPHVPTDTPEVAFTLGGEGWNFIQWYDGSMHWSDGIQGHASDVELRRAAPRTLEIAPNGGGATALRLHSPDGTAYDIKVANGGALSAVAV